MKREWKPGDVALIRVGFREHVALRDSSNAWLIGDSNAWRIIRDDPDEGRGGEPRAIVIRPLAVIDPDDREQIERLYDVLWAVGNDPNGKPRRTSLERTEDLADLEAALREYADPKPPKPEEPMGLGARVVDALGVEWALRTTQGSGGDDVGGARWACLGGLYFDRSWDELLDAFGPVTIEGVTS